MGLALLAVVYSALRAGSNTHLFGFGSEDGDGPADQPLMEEGASAGPEEEHKSSTGDLLCQAPPPLVGKDECIQCVFLAHHNGAEGDARTMCGVPTALVISARLSLHHPSLNAGVEGWV